MLAKKLWSVFTDDMEHCFFTYTPYCERHHIFGAANRNLSEKYGFVIPLAPYLHNFAPNSVHGNPNHGLDLELKKLAQKYYEEHVGSREDFIKEFGQSWMERGD